MDSRESGSEQSDHVQSKAPKDEDDGAEQPSKNVATSNRRWWTLSNAIALTALVVSIGQAIVSSPVISDHYNQPILVATGEEIDASPATPGATGAFAFYIENRGRKTATNLEVAFAIAPDDELQVWGEHDYEILDLDKRLPNKILKLDTLRPKQTVVVIVSVFREFNDQVLVLPSMSYVRSLEGYGEVHGRVFRLSDHYRVTD